MDAQGRNKTLQVAFAFVTGVFVVAMVVVFYRIFPIPSSLQANVFLFAVLPALTYAQSLIINSIVQFISCNTVSIGQVALAALSPPAGVLTLGSLATLFPFLRSPIASAVSWTDETMQKAVGLAFYLFWGAVYGQTIAAGMVTGCPS